MIEYISQNVWQIWIFLAILSLIIELSSGTFYIMCFAIGAAVSALVSALGGGFVAQILTFAIASAVCIFMVRPLVVKYLPGHKYAGRMSNADALIGRLGWVTETIIAGGYGRVAIDGDDWKAQSNDGMEIAKGEKVKVTDRDSIIITVEKEQNINH